MLDLETSLFILGVECTGTNNPVWSWTGHCIKQMHCYDNC